jgi:hypothetical protein
MGPLCTAYRSASHFQRRSTLSDLRPSVSEGRNWPRNGRSIWPVSDFHVSRRYLSHASNLRHRQTALLPLRRKSCHGFFRPKNVTSSARFKPAILGTRGQHANRYIAEAAACTGKKVWLKVKCRLHFREAFIITNVLMFIAEQTNNIQMSPFRQFHFLCPQSGKAKQIHNEDPSVSFCSVVRLLLTPFTYFHHETPTERNHSLISNENITVLPGLLEAIFSPEKCYQNSNCALYAVGNYLFRNL